MFDISRKWLKDLQMMSAQQHQWLEYNVWLLCDAMSPTHTSRLPSIVTNILFLRYMWFSIAQIYIEATETDSQSVAVSNRQSNHVILIARLTSIHCKPIQDEQNKKPFEPIAQLYQCFLILLQTFHCGSYSRHFCGNRYPCTLMTFWCFRYLTDQYRFP